MAEEKRGHLDKEAVLLLNRGRRGLRHLVFGRTAVIIALLAAQGFTVVCCTISMFHSVRAWNRANIPGYYEVYIQASMDTLRQRDQKGLYSRNAENVAGVGLQVEMPSTPDLILDNNGQSTPEEQVALLCRAAKEGV